MRNPKLTLADWLCRAASWLRGEKWYVAETWHGVPGNRAAELRQQIWVEVAMSDLRDNQEALGRVDRDLAELAQAAGEAWGHVSAESSEQTCRECDNLILATAPPECPNCGCVEPVEQTTNEEER